jgi:hypothetical protein
VFGAGCRTVRPYNRSVAGRYRCGECGNLTRFDVVTTRRTKAFHHYSVAGDLTVEDEEVLDEHIDDVSCRWCGAGRERIEALAVDEPLLDGLGDPA